MVAIGSLTRTSIRESPPADRSAAADAMPAVAAQRNSRLLVCMVFLPDARRQRPQRRQHVANGYRFRAGPAEGEVQFAIEPVKLLVRACLARIGLDGSIAG